MPRVGFERTISAGERPKTYALDRAATGTGIAFIIEAKELPHKLDDTSWRSERKKLCPKYKQTQINEELKKNF